MACILLTGGTGKIASRIAPLLADTGRNAVLASRRAPKPETPNCRAVRFDWLDDSTYADVLRLKLDAIFLVAPPVMQCVQLMKIFIDLAIENGVKRLVLLSGSVKDVGDGLLLDEVGRYIKSLDVECVILRPTWFMEDFSETHHRDTIRVRGHIITATGKGKIPFVASDDVAAVAFMALTEPGLSGKEYLILGPELWSFHDVANYLSNALGRDIKHIDVSEEDLAAEMHTSGIEEDFAILLAQLDTAVREGKEERLGGDFERLLGRKAVKFVEWVEKCKERGIWEKVQV